MARLAAVILVVLTFSCSLPTVADWDYSFPDGGRKFADVSSILSFVYQNVMYKADVVGHWQTPEETSTLGTGDCEDFAILFMYYVYTRGFGDPILEGVRTINGNHAMVGLSGVTYDPTYGRIVTENVNVYETYSYGQAIYYAVNQ